MANHPFAAKTADDIARERASAPQSTADEIRELETAIAECNRNAVTASRSGDSYNVMINRVRETALTDKWKIAKARQKSDCPVGVRHDGSSKIWLGEES